MDWFRTSGVHVIRIVGTDYQRMDVLLIPVDTEQAIAHLALTMATDGQDPAIVATVDKASAPVSHPPEAQASSRDNEEDAPDHRAHDRTGGTPSSDVVDRRRVVVLPHGSS